MALFNIYGNSYFFFDYRGTGDTYFLSVWNDGNDSIEVYEYPSPPSDPNIGGVLSSGGFNLPPEVIGTADTSIDLPYQFCEGAALNNFRPQQEFPYANRVVTPNSPVCTVTVCDLVIVQPIAITNESSLGAADGTATITATSSNGTLSYSLNDIDYQSSNFFSGLTEGIYTVYVKDTSNCKQTAQFEIQIAFAFGEKFRAEFFDSRNQAYLIKFLESGYTGATSEVQLAGIPVTHRFNNKNDEKFAPIKTTGVRINLKSITNYEFTDFFNSEDYRGKVEIYSKSEVTATGLTMTFDVGASTITFTEARGAYNVGDFLKFSGSASNDDVPFRITAISGGATVFAVDPPPLSDETAEDILVAQESLSNLFFQGFIVASIYTEEYKGTPYNVSVEATDGLSQLKNEPFDNVDGSVIDGEKSLLEIVRFCLDKIPDSDSLGFHEAINIYEGNMEQAAIDSTLAQTYINAQAYEGLNCYQVLEDICKAFSCRFFQWDGNWHFQNWYNAQDAQTVQRYNYQKTSTTSEVRDASLVMTSANVSRDLLVRWVNQDGNLEVRDAYKDASIKNDLKLNDSLIYNGFGDGFWVTDSQLQNWTNNVGIQKRGVAGEEENTAVSILGGVTAFGSAGFLKSDIFPLDLSTGASGSRIVVKFEYKVQTQTAFSESSSYAINYRLQFGSFYSKNNGFWSNSTDQITINGNEFDTFVQHEKTFFFIPAISDSFSITFYQGVSAYYDIEEIQIKDLSVQFFPNSVKAQATTTYTVENIAYKSKQEGAQLETIAGDGLNVSGKKTLYRSALLLSDGTNTQNWTSRGEGQSLPLLELTLNNLMGQYSRPWQKLTGTIETTLLKPFSSVTDPSNPGRVFFVNGWEWDVKNNRFNIELVESVQGTAFGENLNFRLLEDGTIRLLEFNGARLLEDN